MDVDRRLALVEQVLQDPPPVHVDLGTPPNGRVWGTESDCYRFLAERCRPATRTLETGLGISTVLFAAWGCIHTCVVPSELQVERCLTYLDERGFDHSGLRFDVGFSQDVLPRLEPTPLDLVLVDGSHGFPHAIIDWFYSASRLVEGGEIVFDDMQLPNVRWGLETFLERDPRWARTHRSWKWSAWRRCSGTGSLAEEHGTQTFLGAATPPPRRAPWLPEPVRPLARKVAQRLR